VKGLRAELTLRTGRRTEFVAITDALHEVLSEHGWKEGVLLVFCPHTTAAVAVNEGFDPELPVDFERVLDRLAPWDADYRHTEGNAAAHVKAMLVGHSVTLAVRQGRLALGRWQTVFLCEFDGPRTRHAWLQFEPAPA
jgi:secondary thiamine-phosphate synthase enzyme